MAQPPFQFRAGDMPNTGQVAPSQAPSSNSLPTMDMSVLEGITPEQLATIARLFQSGALQMPPPAPPVLISSSNSGSTTSARPATQPNNGTQEDVDMRMETEEGEVDETYDDSAPSQAPNLLHPPPTGPKIRSRSPAARVHGQKLRRSNTPQARNTNEHQPVQRSTTRPISTPRDADNTLTQDGSARLFIQEMVKAGYSFHDLVPEVRDPEGLSRMFHELNLPVRPKSPARPHQSTPTAAIQPQAFIHQSIVVDEAQQPSHLKRAVAPKPTPLDRSEYLARLKAAKNKKAEKDAKAITTPTETLTTITEKPVSLPSEEPAPVKSDATPKPLAPTQKPENEPSPKLPRSTGARPFSASRALSMTELARQRLEALKAKQAANPNRINLSSPAAARAAPTTPNAQATSSPLRQGLGAGIGDIGSKVAQTQEGPLPAPSQSSLSHVLATPTNSFGRLPGLLMAHDSEPNQAAAKPPQAMEQSLSTSYGAPVSKIVFGQASAISSTPRGAPNSQPPISQLQTASRKRAVAADFDDETAPPSSVKRPFGQSRGNSEDESLVIQVSDDEDDESDVEQVSEPHTLPGIPTKSFRDVGPLRDFPPKPNLGAPSPAVSTPGSDAYALKMKEIEDFKRKIAEKEQRKKMNGKVSGGPTVSGVSTPDVHIPLGAGNESLSVPRLPTDSPRNVVSESLEPARPHPVSADVINTQDHEQLQDKFTELEQDEMDDVKEAVEAAASRDQSMSQPDQGLEHPMPGALPTPEPQNQISGVENRIAQPAQEQTAPVGVLGDSLSEEGEISDDSMSDVYDVQDAQDERKQITVNGDIDSQTTTASAQTEPEVHTEHAQEAKLAEAQQHEIITVNGPEDNVSVAENSVTTSLEDTRRSPVRQFRDSGGLSQPPRAVVYDNGSSDVSMDEDDESEEDLDLDERPAVVTLEEGHTSAPSESGELSEGEGLHGDEAPGTSSSSDVDMQRHTGSPPVAQTAPEAMDVHHDIADDLAPELQPSNDELPASFHEDPAKRIRYFTPYQSPLAGFKDYRYHPEYLDTVSGGHKSMTYSNRIDTQNALCPTETSGTQCTDDTCQSQHFGSLILSDDDLLKTMAIKDSLATDTNEQQRWNQGLGAIIQQMRSTGAAKDAAAIAAAFAEFRRAFLDDPTKVLNLG